MNERGELGEIKTLYMERSKFCRKTVEVVEFDYRNWLKVYPTDEDIVIEVIIDNIKSKKFTVEIYNKDQFLKAVVTLLPVRRRLIEIPLVEKALNDD